MGDGGSNRDLFVKLIECCDGIKDSLTTVLDTMFAILYQPDLTQEAHVGDDITFRVGAINAASYQWQYSSNNSSWTDFPDTFPGTQTAETTLTITDVNKGLYRRCKLVDPWGHTYYTNSGKLTIVT